MDSASYWDQRYLENQTGWDLNGPTPALQAAIEGLPKTAFILIPGCGFGWDGEALWKKGYANVYLSDWAPSAKTAYLERVPDFPPDQFSSGDFFEWATLKENQGKFDVVLECTFYCAIPPQRRLDYAAAMAQILTPGGRLMGVLFTFPLTEAGPPFGGSVEEYHDRFSTPFALESMGASPLSIPPRADKEVFFCAKLQSL